MQPAGPAWRPGLLMHFVQVGGSALFIFTALTLLLTLWGIVNLAFVRNRFALAAQALLSFSPLAYAFVGLLGAWDRFQAMVNAPGPGDPTRIAGTMSLAFLLGFFGSISTAIPAVIGILALARNVPAPASLMGKDAVGEL